MGKLVYVLIIMFILFAIYVCITIINNGHKYDVQEIQTVNNDSIKKEIEILSSPVSSVIKAEAVVALMTCAYILIHTQQNQGQNYNDKEQSRKFQKSLNPKAMSALFGLEGKYE